VTLLLLWIRTSSIAIVGMRVQQGNALIHAWQLIVIRMVGKAWRVYLQNAMCHYAHFEESAGPLEYLAIRRECIGFPISSKEKYHVTRLSKHLRSITENLHINIVQQGLALQLAWQLIVPRMGSKGSLLA
jgi:hypothetical protein